MEAACRMGHASARLPRFEMAENEAPVAEGSAAEQEEEIPYQIKIEDAGPATKKVSIEIPEEVIATKLQEQFKELRQSAAIPGFRPGHAPQKLIEKRFQTDVRDQVRRTLISETYEKAVQKHSLQVIGDPQFDDPEKIELPESGKLTYSFQVEVQPDIALPTLSGLKIKRPKVEVTDKHIDQALENLRQQRGALVPVEDRGVQSGDHLIANVHLKVEGNVVSHMHDANIIAKPGRLGGLLIDDLDKRLEGMKPGEKREFVVHAPDDHSDEKLKGKDVTVDIALNDIKKMELAEVNQDFLSGLGFGAEEELRNALREQMLQRVKYDVQEAMRDQIENYLLESVQIDLPTKLSDRQAERIVQRRALDMMMRGVPRDRVESEMDQLRGGAKDQASRDLKLFFILQKVAAEQQVEVDEAELNGRIALIAAQSGQRPEKVKQEMSSNGELMQMYVQMREQKALDKVLASAQVEDVDLPAGEKKE